MQVVRLENVEDLGTVAAARAAAHLRAVLASRGEARIVLATGTSMLGFLDQLCAAPGIEWSRVTAFHLDEYVGLSIAHSASFRRYVRERFVDRVHPGTAVLIDGEGDPDEECRRVGALVAAAPIDIIFLGIGENGHLAFNDPPADFETRAPYIVVTLDEVCRAQQVGEGWFRTLDEVPLRAISMSIQQIVSAAKIYCIVPERRKAAAVQACLEGEISPRHPASILRRHPDVELYVDAESASLLREAQPIQPE